MERFILCLVVCGLLAGCVTTTSPAGDVTRTVDVAATAALIQVALDSSIVAYNAVLSQKATMEAARYERELAQSKAKMEMLQALVGQVASVVVK